MIAEQDLQVIAKYVIEAFQQGKYKAILPPIRAEINRLKHVGTGYSLVDGNEGENLTLNGLLPGKFIKIDKVGRDLQISLHSLPTIESAHIENLRGVNIKNHKAGDLLMYDGNAWIPADIEDFDVIKEIRSKNSYPDEDREKLASVQVGAQANPDPEEIKSLYEANENTNAFTNADKSNLEDLRVKSHYHKNASLIESYTVSNEEIQKATDWKHAHPNAEILSKITGFGSGKIITADERAALLELMELLPLLRNYCDQILIDAAK